MNVLIERMFSFCNSGDLVEKVYSYCYYGNTIEKYFLVFGMVWLVFLCLISKFELKHDFKLTHTIIKSMNPILISLGITAIGYVLYSCECISNIDYYLLGPCVIIIIWIILIGVIISQIVHYKKVTQICINSCKYIKYVIFLKLFLSTLSGEFSWRFVLISFIQVITIEIIPEVYEIEFDKIRNEMSNDDKLFVTDIPNEKLYPTRQRQLENFIPVLKEQLSEPYAVLITAEWGMGKTSFTKALEKKLDDDIFIWLYAGSEQDVGSIMKQLSELILNKLKENYIYVDDMGCIEEYFETFAGIVNEAGFNWFEKIYKVFQRKTDKCSKEYLNRKLQELNKTIYIVIDDLDRCSEDYQSIMFKVIRESTSLVNCITIFLADKKQFLIKEYDNNSNYIEKYIGYTLELCKVEMEEIYEFLVNEIFTKEFLDDKNPELLKNKNLDDLKRIILKVPKQIKEVLVDKLQEIKNDNMVNETTKGDKVDTIKRNLEKLEKDFCNSRKVKRYLKGIKRDINNINMWFYLVSDTYKKEDWIFAIIIVQAIKYFLPELYWDVKEKYKGDTSLLSGDSIENIILRGLKSKNNFLFIDEYVLWQVMYKIDIIDCKEIMTEREAILMKIESDNIQENDLKSCLKYANSENHFVKIIQFIGNNTEIKYESKCEFIFGMCQCLMSPYNYVLSTEQWIIVSNKFIDVLKEIKLEKGERQQFLHNFNLIAGKLFSKERKVYSVILYNFFSVKEVDTAFGNLSNDVGIGRWYALFMRFRNNGETQNIIQDIDMLDEIRNYFGMLHDDWKRDKEQVDLEDLFVEVDKVCELCKVWINLESSLYVENKEENLLYKYFNITFHSFNQECFSSAQDLIESLKVLRKYYRNKENREPAILFLLLNEINEKLVSEPDWFEQIDEMKQIINDLCKLVEENNSMSDKDLKLRIIRVQIMKNKITKALSKRHTNNPKEHDN